MIKLTQILLTTGVFATIAASTIAEAGGLILGSYKSSGYTLDLESRGDYYSCNPQNRCLRIAHTKSSQQSNTRIWKNAGYTYRVTPVGKQLSKGKQTRISVQIIDSKDRVVSNRIFRSQ
ncbi:hypothetical protein [Chamaesiphon sp.]|uniref:hypothetical protein n=1 Tax=Chamaesiphon sp. TaxID=2814140 RepID=UPI0035948688